MDETFIRSLESKAYYAVVRALAASNKLNFDTEELLMDLQSALSVDAETSMEMLQQAENDPEVAALKPYDASITRAAMGGGGMGGASAMQMQQPVRAAPAAYTRMPAYDTAAGQPTKKQKKPSAVATHPAMGRAVSLTPTGSKAAGGGGGGTKQTKPRTLTQQGSTPLSRGVKSPRPTISAASFAKVMQRGMQDEMDAYLQELNHREKEIFTELISMGVEDSDPDLNELHRELLRWYKLDQRQTTLVQQLATAV